MDQGFEESLVHRGGGIGQPSDPVGGEGKYTDPVLFHNGQQVQTKGYCTDVYFDAAMDWMAGQRNKPFFAYIATNAPHSPLGDVPRELYEQYRSMDLSAAMLPGLKPAKAAQEADALARIFAMVANIDANVGRLMQRLRQLDLLDNTLVLFFNDNGPASPRYVGPLRGQKSEVFEGGVRAALFAHWPAAIRAGRRCDVMAAHIDLMPTILEACGVAAPQHLRLDGRSILPLLTGKGMENWPDRSIVLQAHRGNVPVIYHNFVVETPRWTLLNASGFGLDAPRGAPKFELYDVTADPGEAHDVAAAHPEIVERLRQEYEAWFKDVSSTRADNYAPPRIHIGSPHEPTVVLTRQDWRRPAGEHQGYGTSGTWLLRAERAGAYQVRLRFPAVASAGTVELKLGPRTSTLPLKAGDTQCVFDKLVLEPGDADLRAVLTVGGREQGPWQADVTGP
jgi:arylsulfatase/arylsulfatase A